MALMRIMYDRLMALMRIMYRRRNHEMVKKRKGTTRTRRNRHVSNSPKETDMYPIRPRTSQARSIRGDQACTQLGRYVATERPSRSVATSCILVYPTMLSPEDRSELSSCLPTILRHQSNFAVKTAESLFFIERSRNKRFKSKNGPQGSEKRLEAQLTIS
ncbi:hypothetical protein YC2023_033169 [Brassica napus]